MPLATHALAPRWCAVRHATARPSPRSLSIRSLRLPRGAASRSSRPRRALIVRMAAADDASRLAPLAPESSTGQFLNYILASEPQLFEDAMTEQLTRIAGEIPEAPQESTELVLFERIQQVKLQQQRRSVEDLMYASILHNFVSNLKVDLLPSLDGVVEIGGSNYKALTEGAHSTDAIALVKEHLAGLLGDSPVSSYAKMKISKLQAAQVYAASVMFGYFLRRADRRFQLDRSLGTLPKSPEETLTILESMFNSADDQQEQTVNPDFPTIGNQQPKTSLSLKQYVERFDQETMTAMARIVSVEGVSLVERHTGALFGSIEHLNREFQQAMEAGDGGAPIETPQQLSERIQDAVMNDKVATLVLTYSTQQHVILEAVAFGSFLRDAESMVAGTEPRLLTSAPDLPPPREPPRSLEA